MERKRVPVINKQFIILVPFKNKKLGKSVPVPILNHDAYIDVAHQFGLKSLTAEIVREWTTETPAGLDEFNNQKVDTTRWIEVKATVVIAGDVPGETIVATGFCCANDRDQFVKKPEFLLQVAETRAKNRAIGSACGVTSNLYDPEGKGPDREAPDLPAITIEEEDPDIPDAIKNKMPNITPPLSHPVMHPGVSSSDDLFI